MFSFGWQDNQDASTHIAKLRGLWDELNAGLRSKGENILPDMLLVCKILHILPPSYEMFRSSWMMMTRDIDKSIDELILQICLYERNFRKDFEDSGSNQEALMVKAKKNLKQKNVKHSSKKEDVCHYCKKKGHWLKECRKWIEDGKPSKKSLASSPSTNINVALNIESDTDCTFNSSEIWWIDNGATKHVTNSYEMFSDFNNFNEPQIIKAAGKESIKAYGKGTIEIISFVKGMKLKMKLEDVCEGVLVVSE
ncbi:uncharacterized protein LOC131994190 [Stomoxys calcitrans]|uniref:uncharacterized protein LOC131994190 n=1 Tax=Stomoxys calcitrans TaxID=35570 RepID=UPI0027E247EF|nr:uncharacterized protein LOC131994190 [Stomoxys calcitrans]